LKYTDHIIGEREGFRSGKSTTDQIFKVKELAVKSSALNTAEHNT
jgi:hypothetical protein